MQRENNKSQNMNGNEQESIESESYLNSLLKYAYDRQELDENSL